MRKRYCALNRQMHCKALVASAPLLITWTGPREQAQVDFQLAEQLYARAVIRQPTSVALWLGADVMLEFQLEEAAELLVVPRVGWPIVLLYSQLMGYRGVLCSPCTCELISRLVNGLLQRCVSV